MSLDMRLSDRRADLVADGIDVAIRIGTLDDSSLRARRLIAVRRPLVAAPSYVERWGNPQHPSDLAQHRAILFTHVRRPGEWLFQHPLEGEVRVAVDGPLRIDNGDAALHPLRAGLGLTLLPDFLVWEDVRAGRLLELLPDWAPDLIALHVVTPPGQLRPARVQALIDYLARELRAACWAHALPEEG